MTAHVEVFHPKEFDALVADEIVASIGESIASQGRCTIALAGGRTPSAIYRILSRPPRVDEVSWEKVHLFLGDERWVPHDNDHSNYKMVRETLLHNIVGKGPQIYPVDTALASPEKGAEDYAKKIVDVIGNKNGGCFDLVLLGLGEDGHTASLFPNAKAINEKEKLCVATKNPHDGSDRITLTPKLLMGARKVLFLVKGESKADVVKSILETKGEVQELPARIYRDATGDIRWFLDSAAALRLENKGE